MSLEVSNFDSLHRVYQTVIEMLKDRKYNCSSYQDKLTIEDIRKLYIENNLEIIVHHSIHNHSLMVLFQNDKFGVNDVKELINYLKQKEIKHIILIVKDKLTSFGLKYLKNSNIKYEIFIRKSLMFNITKHKLVPKHQLLTNEEKNKLIESLQCKLVQLPKILKTDSISKYFNATPGQVFKIYRKNEIYYRVVI